MPSPDDDGAADQSLNGDHGPPRLGVRLLPSAVLAWLGVLALLTGVHGVWWMLGEPTPAYAGYGVPSLLWDSALVFVGVYFLTVAVGSAAARLD
ncbi:MULTISPECIES: hypothetical protein [Halobacterium]|uniref:hypothetical protein n=1 Tax=Halobacterium TaxID=2239 RepID=UPI001964E5E2|nr:MULTISPECIES: hypothetical protein [Halobacterium]MDL0123084.1 hypothetical protein [Halobacterium salinarum]MDL0132774.1 hypothetical protein [Halobacterium salinarum]MDL0139572.1 hypothetical protein [Halobacterium salinarum]QRY25181.1 hypothetical protein JRZ79_01900 [Halobacterium sp. BOL4-2]